MSKHPLLEVSNLRLSVRTDEGTAQILDHVALTLPHGRILGVVGESGCGKSTLARAILGLIPKAATIESGDIKLDGESLLALSDREMTARVRGRQIGFIPQDPYLALNPVFKIGAQILPMLRWHAPHLKTEAERRRRLIDLLTRVQMPEPDAVLERYPHQFSGGQRQRLMIAAALAAGPKLVIADEPTTALDVTTQQQILKLLRELAREFDVSMLFVTHDFGVVAELCDEVTVMYAGQTVEAGPTREVLELSLKMSSHSLETFSTRLSSLDVLSICGAFFSVDTKDRTGFITEMLNLVDQPSSRNRIAARGAELYEDKYSWPAVTDQLLGILEKLETTKK